jgi:hypothetical protein
LDLFGFICISTITMAIINISPESSAQNLREGLEREAHGRGRRIRPFVSDIYTYAVENRAEYASPVPNPGRKPGLHIGAEVPDSVKTALGRWAQDMRTSQGRLCCYILEKTIQDVNLMGRIFSESSDLVS